MSEAYYNTAKIYYNRYLTYASGFLHVAACGSIIRVFASYR